MSGASPTFAVADALAALGKRRLVLGIHAPAFPGLAGDDVGRGSPYSRGAARFFEFARRLGFDSVQLGPQGQTSAVNPSPYDGTSFARNVLSIDLHALTRPAEGPALLSDRILATLAAARPAGFDPRRVPYGHVFGAQQRALREAYASFANTRPPEIADRLLRFRQQHESWLGRDAIYDVLRGIHRDLGFRDWKLGNEAHPDQRLWDPPPGEERAADMRRAELVRDHEGEIEAFAFAQMLVHEQHAELRRRCRELGLRLYGDLQIGLSEQDVFAYRSVLLCDYVMGAPPSRTTPEGQAWGYALLDPTRTDARSTSRNGALRLLLARVDKLFAEFDAIRIDHPHGLVCPWAYRADAPDPLLAVQTGARLRAAPDLPDHPELARYAIAEPSQLERTLPRWADEWERELRPEQIDRYAVLFDAMVSLAERHGHDKQSIVCEVLSTLPRPLAEVLKRHGLGRFRVVQKANLDDAGDVYRAENAQPEDWIMAGNHDTPTLWSVVREWADSGLRGRWAAHLAARLGLDAATLLAEPGGLVHAIFAEMLASAAENMSVFFTDLFGLETPYNVPGTKSDDNWSLRLGADFERDYAERLARGQALNLPRALAMALGGRGPEFRHAHAELVSELERQALAIQGGRP